MTQITREEKFARFQALTLMDDAYMRLFFKDNIPCVQLVLRIIMKNGKQFNDGTHIVYVNSSKQDTSTALGKLMHDFRCAKAEDMLYPLLSDKAGALKGDMEGGIKMSILDEIEQEAELRGEARGEARGETKASENIARKLIRAGTLAFEEIAETCSLTLQRVQELAKTIA